MQLLDVCDDKLMSTCGNNSCASGGDGRCASNGAFSTGVPVDWGLSQRSARVDCGLSYTTGACLLHISLSPPESTSQTAFRSVQPFFAELTVVTERQTDRPRYIVCSNRPHLASAATWPNNNKFSMYLECLVK